RAITHAIPGLAVMRRGRRAVLPYLYLLPAFLFFVPFVLVPFAHTVGLSFYDWNGLTRAAFTGFDNYREILGSALVRSAFGHALVLILFFGVLPVLMALPLAVSSARTSVPGRNALRAVIFLPQAIPTVVIGVSWGWILALEGPLNSGLHALGLSWAAVDWLGSFTWALPSLGVVGTWTLIGLCVTLFFAGLQQIPASLYDAAAVDGAGRWREFLAVTLPGLRGPVTVALTVTIISALRAFDLVFVTTYGGPGTQTVVPGLLIYRRAFEDSRLGSAAAIAVILSIVVFSVTFLINRIADRKAP
ncbi:MAG TPA: sugar ABC transporter permease, partial [Povalibacter sp.]|nr:sugar ABC transporter permease [Povalibacter sp.]